MVPALGVADDGVKRQGEGGRRHNHAIRTPRFEILVVNHTFRVERSPLHLAEPPRKHIVDLQYRVIPDALNIGTVIDQLLRTIEQLVDRKDVLLLVVGLLLDLDHNHINRGSGSGIGGEDHRDVRPTVVDRGILRQGDGLDHRIHPRLAQDGLETHELVVEQPGVVAIDALQKIGAAKLVVAGDDEIVNVRLRVFGGHVLQPSNDQVAIEDVFRERARRKLQRLFKGGVVELFALKHFLLGAEEFPLGDFERLVLVDQPDRGVFEITEEVRKLILKLLLRLGVLFGNLRNVLREHFANLATQHAQQVRLGDRIGQHEFLPRRIGGPREEF